MAADGPRAVVHAGRHAIYVDLDGWCLGVVGSQATQVPNALRLAEPDLASLHQGAVVVTDGVLHLDGHALHVGRLVDTRVPHLDVVRPGPHPALPDEVVDLADDCGLSLHEPRRTLGPREVARLVGRGTGLTPLGDDVLCGWLATQRAAGRATPAVDAAVSARLDRTTLLSATLLDCAVRGETLPELAGYLAAVGTAEEPSRARRLAAVGHTSGAGLLYGALLARTEIDHTNGVAA